MTSTASSSSTDLLYRRDVPDDSLQSRRADKKSLGPRQAVSQRRRPHSSRSVNSAYKQEPASLQLPVGELTRDPALPPPEPSSPLLRASQDYALLEQGQRSPREKQGLDPGGGRFKHGASLGGGHSNEVDGLSGDEDAPTVLEGSHTSLAENSANRIINSREATAIRESARQLSRISSIDLQGYRNLDERAGKHSDSKRFISDASRDDFDEELANGVQRHAGDEEQEERLRRNDFDSAGRPRRQWSAAGHGNSPLPQEPSASNLQLRELQSRRQMAKLECDKKSLLEQIAFAISNTQSLAQLLSKAHEENDRLLQALENKEMRLVEATESLQRSESERAHLQERLRSVENDADAAKQTSDQTIQSLTEAVESLRAQVAAGNSTQTQLQSHQKRAQRAISTIQGLKSALQSQKAEWERDLTQVAELNAQLAERDSHFRSLLGTRDKLLQEWLRVPVLLASLVKPDSWEWETLSGEKPSSEDSVTAGKTSGTHSSGNSALSSKKRTGHPTHNSSSSALLSAGKGVPGTLTTSSALPQTSSPPEWAGWVSMAELPECREKGHSSNDESKEGVDEDIGAMTVARFATVQSVAHAVVAYVDQTAAYASNQRSLIGHRLRANASSWAQALANAEAQRAADLQAATQTEKELQEVVSNTTRELDGARADLAVCKRLLEGERKARRELRTQLAGVQQHQDAVAKAAELAARVQDLSSELDAARAATAEVTARKQAEAVHLLRTSFEAQSELAQAKAEVTRLAANGALLRQEIHLLREALLSSGSRGIPVVPRTTDLIVPRPSSVELSQQQSSPRIQNGNAVHGYPQSPVPIEGVPAKPSDTAANVTRPAPSGTRSTSEEASPLVLAEPDEGNVASQVVRNRSYAPHHRHRPGESAEATMPFRSRTDPNDGPSASDWISGLGGVSAPVNRAKVMRARREHDTEGVEPQDSSSGRTGAGDAGSAKARDVVSGEKERNVLSTPSKSSAFELQIGNPSSPRPLETIQATLDRLQQRLNRHGAPSV